MRTQTKKIGKNCEIKKKWAGKVSKPLKNIFQYWFFIIHYFLTAWDFYFQFDLKISINMNKNIKTTKFLRKPLVSLQLNSIAFNEKQ